MQSGETDQMNFPQAIRAGFTNYVNFSGRAARPEYWYWSLFLILGRLVARILDAVIFQVSFSNTASLRSLDSIFLLIVVVPTFAVLVRRLHDVDRSGWWLLVYLTIIGIIYPLLVWKCTKGTEGPNRFGPDPSGIGWAASQFD